MFIISIRVNITLFDFAHSNIFNVQVLSNFLISSPDLCLLWKLVESIDSSWSLIKQLMMSNMSSLSKLMSSLRSICLDVHTNSNTDIKYMHSSRYEAMKSSPSRNIWCSSSLRRVMSSVDWDWSRLCKKWSFYNASDNLVCKSLHKLRVCLNAYMRVSLILIYKLSNWVA